MPNDADRAGTPAGVFGAELRWPARQFWTERVRPSSGASSTKAS